MREIEFELCREMDLVLEDWRLYLEAEAAKEPKAETRIDFRIEKWSSRGDVERVLASAASIPIARAAFQEAIRCYAGSRLTLRHGTRIVEEHAPGAENSHR